jgi:arylsulfatase A
MRKRAVFAISSLACLTAYGHAQRAERPPSFIIILADDLGYGDLGCFGHPTLRTPNLDRMAVEGVRLTSFYAQPSCTPSRAALLTGRLPMRSGMSRVIFPEEDVALPASEITLAEALRDRGYRTAAIGKWHLGHKEPKDRPLGHGFGEYFGLLYSNDMTPPWVPTDIPLRLFRNNEPVEHPVDQDTLTERYTDEAVKWIRTWKDVPFFIYLAHNMPHQPVHASKRFRGTSRRGLYGDAVATIDSGVGKILDALKQERIDGNTFLMFTSDNGPWLVMNQDGGTAGLLRDGKGTTYEGGIRVPFVARWPGQIPAGRVSAGIASTMDLYTTCLTLAGAKIPSDRIVDGKNIMPMLKGEAESPHNTFSYYSYDQLEAIREGPWKLRVTRQPSKEAMLELFDLDTDPSEKFNLAEAYPERVKRMRAALAREQSEMVPGPAYEPGRKSLELLGELYRKKGGIKVGPPKPNEARP